MGSPGDQPSISFQRWFLPKLFKITATERWSQLSFSDGHRTADNWFIPDELGTASPAVKDFGPRFHVSSTEIGSNVTLIHSYDLGPFTLSTMSQQNDRMNIRVAFNLNTHGTSPIDLKLVQFNVDFTDLLKEAVQPWQLVETNNDSIFATFVIDGLRSAVRAIKPPRITVHVVLTGGWKDITVFTAQLVLYVTMSKLATREYLQFPVSKSGFLASMRLWELFQEPFPEF